MSTPKTWFITGTSQGFGLEIVRQALEKGDNVAATTRDIVKLQGSLNSHSDQFLPLKVDLLNETEIKSAVETTLNKFGQIDYLVNNAGYGLLSGIEESTSKEVRDSFDLNVFALLNVTRAALPHMRTKGSGHIVNLSSVFGLIAGAGWGIYCATKFAVEGLTEALAQELKPFGIHVTLVEPGYFRTNFLNNGALLTAVNPIADYKEIAEIKRKHIHDLPGTQPGDHVKGVEAIIRMCDSPNPPLRLLLGSDALGFARYKLGMLQADFDASERITISTDF